MSDWHDGWQPMATAPTDRPILAAIEVRPKVGVTYWEQHVIWSDEECIRVHPDCDMGWEWDAYTHWMPLPPPPLSLPPSAQSET
jgi:hypothetical protein